MSKLDFDGGPASDHPRIPGKVYCGFSRGLAHVVVWALGEKEPLEVERFDAHPLVALGRAVEAATTKLYFKEAICEVIQEANRLARQKVVASIDRWGTSGNVFVDSETGEAFDFDVMVDCPTDMDSQVQP
jgi:hypothetical protein